MFHGRSLFPSILLQKFSLAKFLRTKKLCFSANNSVSSVTSLEHFSSSRSLLLSIAPKLCNPYHRVEFCGVNPSTGSAFHKVINIHVQNFIVQKYFLLHYGILRATTPRVSLLTRPIPGVKFLTSVPDVRSWPTASEGKLVILKTSDEVRY